MSVLKLWLEIQLMWTCASSSSLVDTVGKLAAALFSRGIREAGCTACC